MLKVHSIETLGTHEGPGLRLVVFVQGCQMKCLYCHNPDTQPLSGGQEMSVKEILERLEKGKTFYQPKGGITVSGGEPTLQADEIYKLFKACKKAGYHTALDTNGALDTKSVRKLYDLTDLVLLDIKHIDNEKHLALTGLPNTVPLALAQYREESQKPFYIRYVLVPGYNDDPETLERFAQTFQNYKFLQRVDILPYHTLGVYKYQELGLPYALESVKSCSRETAENAQKILAKYLPNTYIL